MMENTARHADQSGAPRQRFFKADGDAHDDGATPRSSASIASTNRLNRIQNGEQRSSASVMTYVKK